MSSTVVEIVFIWYCYSTRQVCFLWMFKKFQVEFDGGFQILGLGIACVKIIHTVESREPKKF